MILVNGEYGNSTPINDRGLQYGDGLFETIEVLHAKPVFLKQHLDRLASGCDRLKIPQPDIPGLKAEIQQVCQNAGSAVLKIIITRGSGGRGYRQPELLNPTRILSLHPSPKDVEVHAINGITARFCETRLGLSPGLAGIKHLNRLEQVMARAEWDDPKIQEGVVMDINSNVIEGTMSNLFYVKDLHIYTATLASAGVAGVLRAIILNLATEHGLKVVEHNYGKQTLLGADEIFVCNSIIGIWPIKQLAEMKIPVWPLTRQLQNGLSEFKAKESTDAHS